MQNCWPYISQKTDLLSDRENQRTGRDAAPKTKLGHGYTGPGDPKETDVGLLTVMTHEGRSKEQKGELLARV